MYTISFFVLLLSAVSCANRSEKKRLYEIFEQSKRAPEYTKVAAFVNSLEFKQICCDEFANATLERLCPSWRDSVSIDFRTAYFYPTRDTCTVFYTMDLKIKDLDVEPHAIGSIMLCFGELTRKEGGWRVKIDTVQPFPLEQYSGSPIESIRYGFNDSYKHRRNGIYARRHCIYLSQRKPKEEIS